MTTPYTHTQKAPLLGALVTAIGAVLLAVALLAADLDWWFRAGLAVLAVILGWVGTTFTRLTVAVSDEIRVFFGAGRPSRRIYPADIVAVGVVRNSPWYGWGIRWIPGGWLWNAWGLDAVELSLRRGRRLRIGTDQPGDLAAAIRAIARP